ncbi:MAG: type IV pilus twitching motility protein PilT, partial [Candidatus Xenobia bacterium]
KVRLKVRGEASAAPPAAAQAAAGGADATAQALVKAIETLTGRHSGWMEGVEIGELPSRTECGFELNDLLTVMLKHNASDLHLKVGAPATVRIDGELIPIGESKLTHEDCLYLILSNMTPRQREQLYRQKYLDFACEIPGARFRANAFITKGTLSAAYRLLRIKMPTIDELGLPPVLRKLAGMNDGLVLVTGPAGCGKSTSLAAIIDYINTNHKRHIITIEDPIEFVHSDKESLITQREIGNDARNYEDALKQALRQDPNVLLVGEMRDAETMMTASVAAETGHLVFSTLHTPNTSQAVDRILDTFAGEQQKQFRMLFSRILRGVISQKLLPRADGKGRVVAAEILVMTPTMSSLVLEGKTNELYDHMKEGALHGMQTFTTALHRLYQAKQVTKNEAYRHADRLGELRMLIDGHATDTASYLEEADPISKL